jgi:phosphodiesterase/alkaline phosphatase D-like protein
LSNADSRFADSSSIGVSIHRPSHLGVRLHRAPRGNAGGSSAPARRRTLVPGGLLVALVAAACALFAAPASAQLAHPGVSYEFGRDGTAATNFSGAKSGLAFQQADDRLYVAAEEKINAFSVSSPGTVTPVGGSFPFASGGTYSSGIAVDNTAGASAGNLYLSYNTSTKGWDESLTPLEGWPVSDEFLEMCGAAVDNEGNVWVAEQNNSNYSSGSVAEWAPSGGSRIRRLNTYALVGGRICHIAIDQSNNDLYVSPSGISSVYRLSAASDYTETTAFPVGTSSNYQLAVDGQHHILFAAWQGNVKAFDTQTGRVIETLTGVVGNVYGMAVQESTDTLFLESTYNPEKVVGLEAIEVPKPITEEPTANHQVSGSADPDEAGEITDCFFEWGTSTSYGNTEECEETTPIASAETVHATLPGLLGEQTYHYRLVLENENGAAYGQDETIVPHNVIGMHTEPATEVHRTDAQLNGTFEGTNEETTYYFEYGTSSSYGSRSPEAPDEESAGVTAGPTPMSVVVTELEPDTTYHFRVVAENEKGKNIGEDQTFTTPVAVADLVTKDATGITKHSAVLNASFTGTGEPHTFYFEWGPTSEYGNLTPPQPAGNATGTVSVSEEIEGLDIYLPDSVPYHYRVVASNETGTTVGPDHTFETLPPDLPQIAFSGVGGATYEGATVNASINPRGGETVFLVEYGPTAAYGSETPVSESLGDDETAHAVTTQLEGLSPGTTYHYRLVVFNFAGTVHSADATFTTPSPAPPPTPPAAGGPAPAIATPPPIVQPKPKHCRRGQVKRGGRCVKRRRHHRKHKHRKHHGHRKHDHKRHGNG